MANSLTPNTSDEQDDAHNVGQESSDRIFDRSSQLASQEHEAGLDENPAAGKKGTHVDSHGDVVQDNPNADTDTTRDGEQRGTQSLYRPGSNRADQERRAQEKLEGYRRAKLKARLKGFGPVGGVFAVVLLGTGATSIGVLGMFASLAINIKELFTNDHSSHSSVNHAYRTATFAAKFTKGNCTGLIPIACRFATLSDKHIARLEKAGFTVEKGAKTLLGRNKVLSITAPDGQKAVAGKELNKIVSSSLTNARAIRLATKGRAAFYLNQKMYQIMDRFKINNLKKLTGKTTSEMNKQVDSNTNGTAEDGDKAARRKATEKKVADDTNKMTRDQLNKFATEVNQRAGRAGNLALVAMGACGLYNMGNKSLAYAKNYQEEVMMRYSALFMTEADAIKDMGDSEPYQVEYVGDTITYYENNPTNPDGTPNEKYMRAGTDSVAYETALTGATRETPGYAKKYRPGSFDEENGKGWLSGLSDFIHLVEKGASITRPENNIHLSIPNLISNVIVAIASNLGDPMKGLKGYYDSLSGRANVDDGREAIRYYCKKAPEVAMLSFLVVCGAAIGGLLGIVTIPISAIMLSMCALGAACAGAEFLSTAAFPSCTDVLKKVLGYGKDMADRLGATDYVLGALQTGAVGSFLQGVDTVEVWGAGNAFLNSAVASGYGMRPATSGQEAKTFIDETSAERAEEEKFARLEAQDKPFDFSNRYSFLGSITTSLQPYYDSRTPVLSGITSILGAVPNAIRSIDPTARADHSMPIQTPMQRYDCEDQDLQSIGIEKTDRFCNTVGVVTQQEMQEARKQANDENQMVQDTITYMTTPQKQNEPDGGTLDDSFCDIVPSKECRDHRARSEGPSVDENGKPIDGTQYARYLQYCTDAREAPWGMLGESIQTAMSNRDIDWFTGKQCLKDSNMMIKFRAYTNLCIQTATDDEEANCWGEEAPQQSSACANGGNAAIYTCALKYDNYGYEWGGGHGQDMPNAQDWIASFNRGEIAEWTHILDCSGLVRVAFVEAMGIEDQAYVAPGGYGGSQYWDEIPLSEAKQGDIITQSGHVAIVQEPASGGQIKIFHASTAGAAIEKNILHDEVSTSSVIAAYRAKKGSNSGST